MFGVSRKWNRILCIKAYAKQQLGPGAMDPVSAPVPHVIGGGEEVPEGAPFLCAPVALGLRRIGLSMHREILLPSASPPRRESTPSNVHTKQGKNDMNTA